MLRWGIDLGGTKIEGVVIDEDHPESPLCRLRVPTQATEGYERIVSNVALLVEKMEGETGSRRAPTIGIGTPGSAGSDGRMRNCNTTTLNGRTLPADLAQALGVQVRVENDANCFALAESRLGAGRGAALVFGVIMGTGVGGGVIVMNSTVAGAQGIAGEWGHNVLEPEGEPCYCGKRGCVETVLSGPALERYYERLSGRHLPLSEIVQRDDANADRTIERLCTKFGEAISTVINILDPVVVLLGGGVGNVRQLRERAWSEAAKWAFTEDLATRFEAPTLGDSAGVFGAALLS